MQRITVAILDRTKERVYHPEPYMDIPGASILYYPKVSDETLIGLLEGTPEQIQQILGATANLS